MIFKWEIRLWIFFLNLIFFYFSIFQFFLFKKEESGIWIYLKTFYFNFRNIFQHFTRDRKFDIKKIFVMKVFFFCFVWISYFRGLICLSNHDCFQVIFIGKFLNIYFLRYKIYLSHPRCVFEVSVFFLYFHKLLLIRTINVICYII